MQATAGEVTLEDPQPKSAIVEYNATEAALAKLRETYKGAVFDVTTTKGLDQAKEARKELRSLRTALELKRKDLKAPILERGELIDNEAKRITAALKELEEPIDEQIKAEERRREAEKEERERLRRERAIKIAGKIDEIRRLPIEAVSKTSAQIAEMIEAANALVFDTGYDEFAADAWQARDRAVAELESLKDAKAAQEAEAERLRVERERQEAERRESEARAAAERAEAERIAAIERQRIAAEQAERDAAARAERERLDAERAELDRQRAEIAAQQEAIAKAERERLAAERQRAEAEARAKADKERQEREAAEAKAREEAEALARRERDDFLRNGPGKEEIVRVLADHYTVGSEVVIDWLGQLDL